ncbi:MAG: NADH-quinone oxidoreductase subunit NuoH [Pirellulaceae bacterium]
MADFFAHSLSLPSPLAYLLAAVVHSALILSLVAVAALFFIWLERKVSGRIQDRLGPTRVGGKFGWLQTLADGIKLITKEDLAPRDADQILFRVAPYISFAASYTAFLALPFANGWVAFDTNVAVFFILAVLGLEVFGVILAGYASGSKWSLFGAMREAAQVVSYEVPMGICVVVPVLLAGTMNLTTIANMQAGWFTNWLIFHDPFTFAVFWVYFACALASVNRAPFDLAEAESELVAGFLTEYSGLRWSYFFMAEYGSMLLVSGLATILFFGGWNGPIPLFHMLGWTYESGAGWSLLGFVANLGGCINFIVKAVCGVTFMIWVRWTLPRLRIDQVMTMCLKYCVPLGAICFVGVLLWQVMGLPSPNDWLTLRQGPAGVRETWLVQPAGLAEERSLPAPSAAASDREAPRPSPEAVRFAVDALGQGVAR